MITSLEELSNFLQKKYESNQSISSFNKYLYSITGVTKYFDSEKEFQEFQKFSKTHDFDSFSTNNREWGDIQTPKKTTDKICKFLKDIGISPDVILEPTYGTGNFILSSLENFPKIRKVYGIEFHKNYEWSFKAKLLQMLLNSKRNIPEIKLFNDNIFNHIFDIDFYKDTKNILVIGNPPWVTNTELSFSESTNLPEKRNFKKFKGIDAITGKSNFDLAEFIILQLLELFSEFEGELVMLCKNTVAKNIVKELPNYKFKISNIRTISIDSREIFGKSVDASLMIVKLGGEPTDFTCSEISFENPDLVKRKFGWAGEKFVSNISNYLKIQEIDGACCFNWRSGIKHDCAEVLELRLEKNNLFNKSSELVEIESGNLYPLLKGSMLKNFLILESNKRLIITQRKVGEDTQYLRKFPKLWKYLKRNLKFFNKRKSVIYRKNLDFSIFGVGDYSFEPYKVAIAGMYKEPRFSLCMPIGEKPTVFDDTCYFLSFTSFQDALFTNTVLNSETTKKFLKSIAFLDSKRPYTKENLARINLKELCKRISFKEIQNIWADHKFENREKITNTDYKQFVKKIS